LSEIAVRGPSIRLLLKPGGLAEARSRTIAADGKTIAVEFIMADGGYAVPFSLTRAEPRARSRALLCAPAHTREHSRGAQIGLKSGKLFKWGFELVWTSTEALGSLVLAGAMIVAGCQSDSAPTSPSASTAVEQRIAVLGDSLATSPSSGLSFPAILQSRLEAKSLRWTVHNAGVRGDTTTGGVRRLDAVLAQNPAILVVALGANDGIRGVDVAAVTHNLATVIARAQARQIRVLLCGMEAPPFYGWNYTLAFHEIFPDLARKYNVPLVPFLLARVVLNPEMNGEDLIHPNAAGARQIADTVWPYLEPMLTQSVARR
jgi:acyl-CoA thioesterase I